MISERACSSGRIKWNCSKSLDWCPSYLLRHCSWDQPAPRVLLLPCLEHVAPFGVSKIPQCRSMDRVQQPQAVSLHRGQSPISLAISVAALSSRTNIARSSNPPVPISAEPRAPDWLPDVDLDRSRRSCPPKWCGQRPSLEPWGRSRRLRT